MREHNEFDELARRKLEEREFPFREEHWLEAEKALGPKEDVRSIGAWWFPILTILIGGGLWLYFTQQDPAPLVTQDISTKGTIQERNTEPGNGSDQGSGDDRSLASTRAHEREHEPSAGILPDEPSTNRGYADTRSDMPTNEDATAAAVKKERIPDVSGAHSRNSEGIRAQGGIVVERSTTPSMPVVREADQDTNDEAIVTPIDAPTSTQQAAVGDQRRDRNRTADVGSRADVAGEHRSSGAGDDNVPATGSDRRPGKSANTAIAGHDPNDAPARSKDNETSTISDPRHPIEHMTSSPNDPSGQALDDQRTEQMLPIAILPTVPDATPSPMHAAPTPLVDPRSPLELSFFAGGMITSSGYGGAAGELWQDRIESGRSITGGIEFMRMGRHFGIGGGIHFSDHNERISTTGNILTSMEIARYYYLTAVDTNLLIITDTILIGNEEQYVGSPVNTTVNVIQEGWDTTTTTTRTGGTRDHIDRMSYLEIPLLMDLHLRQGAWDLGVRGGPMLGILTRNNGHIASILEEQHPQLVDRENTSIMFGYTLRAYMRYRILPGWSIGVEPMIRGHLTSTIQGDGIIRRPMGMGGVISLTHRLR